MNKYIDAELLRKEVKRLEKAAHKSALGCADSETRKFHEGKDYAYQHVGVLIDSLQQEQDLIIINKKDWEAQEQFLKNKKFGVPLQQKQAEIDLEEEIDKEWIKCLPTDEGMGLESANIVNEQFDAIARHFYELGQREMRRRITNPEYNAKVVERIKSEYPKTTEE